MGGGKDAELELVIMKGMITTKQKQMNTRHEQVQLFTSEAADGSPSDWRSAVLEEHSEE